MAVTSICIVCVSTAPKVSATCTSTGCANCPSPLFTVLNCSVEEVTFNVSTPFVANLTRSAVYPDCVVKVNAWDSGSVAVNVVIVEPLATNSAVLNWVALVIDGPVLGKNTAFKKSWTLPVVPALNDDVNNPGKWACDITLLPLNIVESLPAPNPLLAADCDINVSDTKEAVSACTACEDDNSVNISTEEETAYDADSTVIDPVWLTVIYELVAAFNASNLRLLEPVMSVFKA